MVRRALAVSVAGRDQSHSGTRLRNLCGSLRPVNRHTGGRGGVFGPHATHGGWLSHVLFGPWLTPLLSAVGMARLIEIHPAASAIRRELPVVVACSAIGQSACRNGRTGTLTPRAHCYVAGLCNNEMPGGR